MRRQIQQLQDYLEWYDNWDYDNNENSTEIGSSCNNEEDHSFYHRSHHDATSNFSF